MDKVNSATAPGAVNVEQPDRVDWTAFSDDVLRFESRPAEPRQPIPFNMLLALLEAAVHVGEALDVLKKGVFYGKVVDGVYVEVAVMRAWAALTKVSDPAVQNSVAYRPSCVTMRELHALLGMVTETSELAEALLMALRGETPLDTANVLEEMGDLAWYQAVYLDEKNIALDSVLRITQAKLARRYGTKYNDTGAVQRDLSAERAVIEQHTPPASDR